MCQLTGLGVVSSDMPDSSDFVLRGVSRPASSAILIGGRGTELGVRSGSCPSGNTPLGLGVTAELFDWSTELPGDRYSFNSSFRPVTCVKLLVLDPILPLVVSAVVSGWGFLQIYS